MSITYYYNNHVIVSNLVFQVPLRLCPMWQAIDLMNSKETRKRERGREIASGLRLQRSNLVEFFDLVPLSTTMQSIRLLSELEIHTMLQLMTLIT